MLIRVVSEVGIFEKEFIHKFIRVIINVKHVRKVFALSYKSLYAKSIQVYENRGNSEATIAYAALDISSNEIEINSYYH